MPLISPLMPIPQKQILQSLGNILTIHRLQHNSICFWRTDIAGWAAGGRETGLLRSSIGMLAVVIISD